MSSKIFETQLCIKNYKDNVIQELIALDISDINICVIDNWQYENETPIHTLTGIEEYVNNGKIVVIDGKYKKLDCDCNISKTAGDCYEFDVWVPTKIDNYIDDECVSEQNDYDMVVELLKKCIEPHELIFCVSGIGMCVEYNNNLNEILNNSSGILQIICLRNLTTSKKSFPNVKQDGYCVIIRPLQVRRLLHYLACRKKTER